MPIDDTKWDSGEVLAHGVLRRPGLRSKCPADAKLTNVDEEKTDAETLRAGLSAGGLNASMYYGLWRIWKADTGYDGELMQYRNLTDTLQGATIEQAIEKAQEWAEACYG
jgi:hypothetical protein